MVIRPILFYAIIYNYTWSSNNYVIDYDAVDALGDDKYMYDAKKYTALSVA